MFPQFITQQLLLRKIVTADLPKIFEALSDPVVIKHYGVSYSSLQETNLQLDFFNGLLKDEAGIWWAVCYKDEPTVLIGACGFNNWNKPFQKIELGYWLLPAYWGKSIMTEAIPFIIEHAFITMKVHRIEAVVETGNTSSANLLQKLRFHHEGTLVDCEVKNEEFISLQYWALLNR